MRELQQSNPRQQQVRKLMQRGEEEGKQGPGVLQNVQQPIALEEIEDGEGAHAYLVWWWFLLLGAVLRCGRCCLVWWCRVGRRL